ncbi:phosphatidylinositol-specific phospholipase C1-like protein [Saccharomonospora cyanea]|uniref:Calcium-dependent phosphoinositide phospholipase C n=1 Tax=Saccharomonospora cyanea NA-134 TaxID=882082 RepID=H5XGT4_9PSEU|nr:phosphatidylinositol-specific phospholipase C1-like protein [Saccharomonospora cyanea]EHR61627.1 hypothetical protein SaccyDRAFT_2781 [Saccharomonospora cyanea NA-134]
MPPHRFRTHLTVAAVAATTGLLLAPTPGDAHQSPRAGSEVVRLNHIQAVGTHNSYHRELTDEEKAVQQRTDRNWWNLAYSHASIPDQLTEQAVRSIELDLFPDPEGGLYPQPLVRTEAGLGPIEDPAMRRPGTKVLHWADHDYGTSCATLVTCLRQVRDFSEANPGHVPIVVMLEFKRTDPAKEALGGPKSPPWNEANLDAVDAEIRSVFGEDDMITPDDVRLPGRTLEESVLSGGWPTLRQARGTVLFLMDNNRGPARDNYLRGRPSLEGRVLFTNSNPGQPDAAYVQRNDPTGSHENEIRALVRAGYLVRTRADVPFSEARSGDTSRLEAALASGAQIISTDFPAVGLAARHGSDYVARVPGGTPARCDPVNAPRSCDSEHLDRLPTRPR